MPLYVLSSACDVHVHVSMVDVLFCTEIGQLNDGVQTKGRELEKANKVLNNTRTCKSHTCSMNTVQCTCACTCMEMCNIQHMCLVRVHVYTCTEFSSLNGLVYVHCVHVACLPLVRTMCKCTCKINVHVLVNVHVHVLYVWDYWYYNCMLCVCCVHVLSL